MNQKSFGKTALESRFLHDKKPRLLQPLLKQGFFLFGPQGVGKTS
jgi:hypothetical protein